ncbi:helix-turn-helix transcriptional regulator [Burkholderia diffusa]|uniref:helix-turn-helix transcriptional regulator n=1 Tax=Burkholderia diffusa TaxID=488732 RepID=UPI00157A364C|nr:hypothetical protein [Burkholderia diffusa]NTY39179.1 hypothetical protein [Burkholderia diffusa]
MDETSVERKPHAMNTSCKLHAQNFSEPRKKFVRGMPMTTPNQDPVKGKSDDPPTSGKVDRKEPSPLHPGAVVKKFLSEIDFESLCLNLAMSPKELSLFIEEKIPLTARIALRLSRTLAGRNFYEWMKIQNDYDLHWEEIRLKPTTSHHTFDFSHLLPAENKNKRGKQKLSKDFRKSITHFLVNQIEENINQQRKQAGLFLWKDRDFEKAFSLGTENDAHAGRQWRRLKSKSDSGTTEDRIMQIKQLAEKNGWLPPTQFDINHDMIEEFLETQDLHFLDSKKWEICRSIEFFSDSLKQCTTQRLVLWGSDVSDLDPEESVLDESSSEDEIQEFILEEIDTLHNKLMWMTIALRTSQ